MTDPFAPIAPATPKPRRKTARDATFLKADVRRQDGSVLEGLRVRNLSSGGLMVETPEAFDDEEAVSVVLRNVGAVPSHVAWMAEQRVGIAFDRPINPEAVLRAPAKSPGTSMQLLRPAAAQSRRPGLKVS